MSGLWGKARRQAATLAKKGAAATAEAARKGRARLDEQRRQTHVRALIELKAVADFCADEVDFSTWPEALSALTLEELQSFPSRSDAESLVKIGRQRREQAKAEEAKRQAQAEHRDRVLAWATEFFGSQGSILEAEPFDLVDKKIWTYYIDQKVDQIAGRPHSVGIATDGLSAARQIIGSGASAYRRSNASVTLQLGAAGATIQRPLQSLSPQERFILHAAALQHAYGGYTKRQWQIVKLSIAYGNGQSFVQLNDPGNPFAGAVQEIVHAGVKHSIGDYGVALNALYGGFLQLAETLSDDDPYGVALRELMTQGASWFSPADIENSLLCPWTSDSQLVVGRLGEALLGFEGGESLLTVGPPGCGKTQAQVIPNVLTYAGPLIALDIKGEVFEATAGHRQERGSRVLKFSLMNDGADRHAYNPLDFIDADAATLWDEAAAFAALLITRPAHDRDPFWVNSARDLLAVHVAATLLLEKSSDRTLATVMKRLMRVGEARLDQFEETAKRADEAGVPALSNMASAFAEMSVSDERVFESILGQARQATSILQSSLVSEVTGRSDWRPDELRAPGASLYLLVPNDKIEVYAPLLRVVIAQHINALTRSAPPPDALPVTLFLDELPQLGNFDSLIKAIEVGRGYGVRVWAFAQHAQQIEKTFERAAVILDNPAVRCFMNPDQETAERISRQLGERENIATGKKEPLAAVSQLMGPSFKDQIIMLSRGSWPARLTKVMAHQELPKLTVRPYSYTQVGYPPCSIEDVA
jgi:type IV secretion system protein VirD4